MSEDTVEPRKASDVLLSLEVKINNLTKIISVYDMNIKLILDRVNKVYNYIEKLQNEMQAETSETQNNDVSFQDHEVVQSSGDNLITVTENPIGHRRTSRPDTYVRKDSAASSDAEPNYTNAPKDSSSDKKIPVIQRVTDPTGKDLFMAEVTILNDQKELVLKTKTNAAGKWQAYLKPGMYVVNIVKTDTATKKKFEALQDITVNDSSTILTLPTAIIKK